MGLVLTATLALTVLGVVFSNPLTAVFSPGFLNAPEKFDLAAALLRWTFPYLVLVSLVAWAMGVLNAEGSFAAPAAAPIFLNVGIIGAILLFSGYFAQPVMAIAGGVLAGGVAQVLLQGPATYAIGDAAGIEWATTQEFITRHNPVQGGYIVQYEDGYMSYSPQGAFEEGYALAEAPVQ